MPRLEGRLQQLRDAKNPPRDIPQERHQEITQLVHSTKQAAEGSVSASEQRLAKQVGDIGSTLIALHKAVQASSTGILSSMPKETDISPLLAEISRQMTLLGQIKEVVQAIEVPEVDLSAIEGGVRALGEAVSAIKMPEMPEIPEAVDYSGRLEAIEARLAELERPKKWKFEVKRVNSMPNSPIKQVEARQVD